MLGVCILVFYSISLVYYCLCILVSSEEKKSATEWVFAIILPIAVVIGAVAYPFVGEGNSTIGYAYLPFWVGGFVALIMELADIKKAPGGMTVVNVIGGTLLLGCIFGPGMLLGGIWLRNSFV